MFNFQFKNLKFFSVLALSACAAPDTTSLTSQAKGFFGIFDSNSFKPSVESESNSLAMVNRELTEIMASSPASAKLDGSFQEAVKSSVEGNPDVLSARANYQARLASIALVKTGREFRFDASLLGGIEDITDETVGAVAVINGKKMIYDGGKIDSFISRDEFLAQASLAEYKLIQNEKLYSALAAWVNLKRYSTLNGMIQSRLEVLAPLIEQLEQVAEAGLGDASQVAAAERTVNMIRVTEKEVAQQLAQSKVVFENIYGSAITEIAFEGAMISRSVPSLTEKLPLNLAPSIVFNYARYGAAVSNYNSVIAKGGFDVAFETKIQRPLGGSNYDSDESVGIVVRRTIHDGGSLEAEKLVARAQVSAAIDALKSAIRATDKKIKEAQEATISIRDAMVIANTNARNVRDEISYLRQQLIIGQSSLDSVLSAEARLYEAEANSVNLISDQYLSEMAILAALGTLGPIFELN